jgi:hypothetical protein
MNHVFVDFENVQTVDLALIGSKGVSIKLLLGPNQTKLNLDLVEKLMKHAASVELIRLTFSGNNALDFALAYYLGQAVLADPTAYFHVVTKDKGFDPLITHLKGRHVRIRRHNDFSELTFSAPPKSPAAPNDDLAKRVTEHLSRNKASRPKRKKTLASHLLAFAGNSCTETQIMTLIEKLVVSGQLGIDEKNVVTYHI